VTQQNAAMVEQSTAASHALAREAQELTALMAQFKIGGTSSAARPSSRSAPAATRTMMKTTGQGGAALKPTANPAEESWQDF
jgi:methyl-accepting chemotaxis protein